jgi:virginiamycin A acetyltransferase
LSPIRKAIKWLALAVCQIVAFPAALISRFGRSHEAFLFFAQYFALFPGIVGSYLRVAYYTLTLENVGTGCQISLGSYFAHSQSSMSDRVGIGAYCVLGHVSLGEGTLLASRVQVISGSRQHLRDERGHLTDVGRSFDRIMIGKECWIGAGAIIMADLADMVTVAAGSVVSYAMPDGVVVAGNPARGVGRSSSSISEDLRERAKGGR